DGEMQDSVGLCEHWRAPIALPGAAPIPRIRFSIVDVPDHRVLPQRWPGLQSIWVGAGLRPAVVHGAIVAMAWLRAHKVFPPLEWLSTPMSFASGFVRWGAHRGGLVVEVDGVDADDTPHQARWTLLAEGDGGPRIPVMAAATLVLRWSRGTGPSPGAYQAQAVTGLEDYVDWFEHEAIKTHMLVRDVSAAGVAACQARPLYRQVLEDAYDRLPSALQALHDVSDVRRFEGRADVSGARNPVARLVARIVGFPRDLEDIPVAVRLEREGDKEIWRRNFDGQKFHSVQYVGTRRYGGMLVEQFGPMRFGLAVLTDASSLRLDVMRWDILGVPMPALLAPRCDAVEEERDGLFRFSVKISLPVFGMLVHYRGFLRPDEADDDCATASD
ncbi:MAG: DUF4166 domain-containing protein, partial [Pseudomonadota bacterium]